MINLDNIDISDYYVSIEYLDKFHDSNIDKWIESGNSKKIRKKLNNLVQNGGTFSSNHYNVLSSDLTHTPMLYKKNDKWFIEYIETRDIHFFPKFSSSSIKSTNISNEILSINIDSIPNETNKMTNKRKLSEYINDKEIKNNLGSPKKKKRKCEVKLEIDLDNFKIPEVPNSKNSVGDHLLPTEKPDLLLNLAPEKKRKKKFKNHLNLQEKIENKASITNDQVRFTTIKADNSITINGDNISKSTNPAYNQSLPSKNPDVLLKSETGKKHTKKSKKRKLSEEHFQNINDNKVESIIKADTFNVDNKIDKKKKKSHKSTGKNNEVDEIKLEKIMKDIKMANSFSESEEPIPKKHKNKKHSEFQPIEIKKEKVHKKSKHVD